MKTNRFPLLAIFICAILASIPSAKSANVTWSGSNSTLFSSGSNWVLNVARPIATTTDVGVFAGTVPANKPSLDVSRSIAGLSFTTSTGGWTLSSGSSAFILTVGGSGINSTSTSGTNTISANITTASGTNQSWRTSAGSTLLFTGSAATSGSTTLTLGAASGGTVVLNPGAGNSINVSASNTAGRALLMGGGTIVLGGDGGIYGAKTSSTNFIVNNSGANSASWQWSQNTTLLINSGIWNFGDVTSSAAVLTGTLAGGLMQVTGLRSFSGGNGTTFTVNGGTLREGTVTSSGGLQPGANANRFSFGSSVTSGTTNTFNIQSGFVDLATASGSNTIGNTSSAANNGTVLLNQSGGLFMVGVTSGTGTNKDFFIGGIAGTTGTNALTLTSGTMITAGNFGASTVGAGGVNNFNFLGGTLTSSTITATTSATARPPPARPTRGRTPPALAP